MAITKTFGSGGTYATFHAAVITVTWPLTDDVVLQQVGSSTEPLNSDQLASMRNFAGHSFTVTGDTAYTMTIPTLEYSTLFYIDECTNISHLSFDNLSIVINAFAWGGTLHLLFIDRCTYVNNAEIFFHDINFRNNAINAYSIAYYHGGNTNGSLVIHNYIYNIILYRAQTLACLFSDIAYNHVYISNCSTAFGDEGPYPCIHFSGAAASTSATAVVRNNYLSRGAARTALTDFISTATLNSASYTGFGNIYSKDTALDDAFENWTTNNNASYFIPKVGAPTNNGGVTPAGGITSASPWFNAHHTRYLNSITFNDLSPAWQVGAKGRTSDLDAPTNLSSRAGESAVSITINWTAAVGADGYLVYRSSLGPDIVNFEGASAIATITSGVTTSYIDNDLALNPKVDYYYRIRSYKN